jgi:hypothetical protein
MEIRRSEKREPGLVVVDADDDRTLDSLLVLHFRSSEQLLSARRGG